MNSILFRILYYIICLNLTVTLVCDSFLINKSNSNTFVNKIVNLNDLNGNFNKNVYNNVSLNSSIISANPSDFDPSVESINYADTSKSKTAVRRKRADVIDRGSDDDLFEDNLEYYKLNDYMGSCFLQYALSIILGRALPDSRDGLKVVHRRILWAMHILKLGPSGQFRKCAKVVGDVLGNYHPHSDKSVYDALCRLSQDFVMKMPLIDGHGNFGSSDDPPAAMRYTECRLTQFSKSLMLEDINLNTVDLVPNFDNTHFEPLVLPCRIPNLLINGSSGIAVGLATNIPPHNPTEIIRAAMHLSKNNGVLDNEDELLEFVKGPDFPTGGTIKTTTENFKKIYKTGRGTLLLQSKFTFEEKVKRHTREVVNVYKDFNDIKFKIGSRISIVVTEIPYNIKISDVIVNINKNIRNSNLTGISDVRDESDRNGTRLVIELKKQISSTIEIAEIVNKLNNLTELSHYFKCNFIALDKNGTKPIRFNLFNSISIWLEFRILVLKRKFKYLLKQSKYYLNVTNGYLIIIRNLQPIIKLIKSYSALNNRNMPAISSGTDAIATPIPELEAEESSPNDRESDRENEKELYKKLSETYGLNELQIKYAMKMTLRQLSRLNEETLKVRKQKLESEIAEYQNLIADDKLVYKQITNDLQQVLDTIRLNERTTKIQIIDDAVNPKNIPITNTVLAAEASGANAGKESGGAEDGIDNLIIYNEMGYLSKIKLDNRFYKSNRNKAIRTKLLFSNNSGVINTAQTQPDAKSAKLESAGKQKEGADGTKGGASGAESDKVSYLGSNNNNGLIVVSENRIYNLSNAKLKLCKRGYSLFKFLQLKPYDQRVLYLSNYKPPLKDVLLFGFDDGSVAIFNNTSANTNKNGLRLKLKLPNVKDRQIRFFLHTNTDDLNNKHIFVCTKMGNCLKLSINDIIAKMVKQNKKRKNIRLIKLKDNDEVASVCLTQDNQQILILTNLGRCKLINSSDIKLQKTKGKGYKIIRPPSKNKTSVAETVVNCHNIESTASKNNLLLISRKGVLCKKQMKLAPCPKHHKTKKFWSNMPATDELYYSKSL